MAPGSRANRFLGLVPAGAPAALLAAVALLAAPPRASADGDAKSAVERQLARVERHAVVVSLRFQRDLAAEENGVVPVDPDGATEVFRRWRMSMRVPGLVVRDRRTVLCSDLFLPDGAVQSIEVTGRGGTAASAHVKAFLRRAGGIVLATDRDVDAEPVPFSDDGAVTVETPLVVGSISESATGAQSWAEPLAGTRRRDLRGFGFAWGTPEKPLAGLMGARYARTVDLVMREDATPVGVRFGGTLALDDAGWRGKDVLAELAEAVPFESLADLAATFRRTAPVYRVRLAYRPEGPEDEAPGPWRGAQDVGEPDDDVVHFGIAVAPDLVVVPEPMPEPWIGRIDRVVVEPEGRPALAATFAGRVRNWGAFAVRLSGSTLPALGADAPEAPKAGTAFLAHAVAWRGGERRDHVEYHRSLGSPRGYGDVRRLASEETVPASAFLWTLAGHAMGFSAELRPEDAEAPARARRGDDEGSRGVHAALFADFGGPGAIASALDVRVMPRKGDEGRRLPWLGVEVEPIRDAAVAAALGVSGPTRDGARGLVVNHVYANSPAERAGILVDDILLSARRTGPTADAAPADLRDTAGAPDWPDASDVPRPWRPRANALVRLLASWGVGTRYEVEIVRGGAVVKTALAVETSPRDVATALRIRDEGSGLTVKELTYEVRYALHLANDAPGVLASAVEEGSAAFQARILANEVVREVDGHPVADPEAFAAALATARSEGRESVRLVVLRLDRSRFVDLHVTHPGPEQAAGAVPPPR